MRFQISNAAQQIKQRGVTEVRLDDTTMRHYLNTMVEGMQRLTNDAVLWSDFPRQHIADGGYGIHFAPTAGLEIPANKGIDPRLVFTFDYAADMQCTLPDEALAPYASFFRALDALADGSIAIAKQIAREFDEENQRIDDLPPEYPGSMAERLENPVPIVRVLRYLHKHNYWADHACHIDPGLFTIHWSSTHEGLVLFDRSGTKCTVSETNPERAAVFAGQKFAAATRGMFGLGTPHGVRDLRREKRMIDIKDRYAILCFVHPTTLDGDASWLKRNEQRIQAHAKKFFV